jgi:redox-sensitive bicupin YhaK (pirin superfamily)
MPAVTVDDLTTLSRIAAPGATAVQRPVRSVTTAPRGFEGEGFPVFRAFAGVDLAALDPFVHLDQMGEVDYGPGEPKGTPWHPHRGFETVTYMMDGLLRHNDSQGGGGLISDGGTQWMTAGQGILHIETPPEDVVAAGGLFHGLQLWVNLPKAQKWVPPRYQDLAPESVLLLASDDAGALVRVIAGDLAGHRGPGATYTPITMLHASVSPGAQLVLPWPKEFNALVYILAGRGSVGAEQRPLHQGQLAVLGAGDAITVAADPTQDGRTAVMEVLLLGGRPIREPVAWGGPFVMNTKAELAQAFEDFEAGRLGQVPAVTDAPTREVREQIDSALD